MSFIRGVKALAYQSSAVFALLGILNLIYPTAVAGFHSYGLNLIGSAFGFLLVGVAGSLTIAITRTLRGEE